MPFMCKEQKQSEDFKKIEEVSYKKYINSFTKTEFSKTRNHPLNNLEVKIQQNQKIWRSRNLKIISIHTFQNQKKILRSRWKFERKNELKSNWKIKYFLKIYSDKHCFVKLIVVLATSCVFPGQIWKYLNHERYKFDYNIFINLHLKLIFVLFNLLLNCVITISSS